MSEMTAAREVREGDEIELPSGIVGVVFSAEAGADGALLIYVEAPSGGMQSETYAPDALVKLLRRGTV